MPTYKVRFDLADVKYLSFEKFCKKNNIKFLIKPSEDNKSLSEETWNSKLWELIEIWMDNQGSRNTAHLATSDYNKVEEFIQGMLDEKDKRYREQIKKLYEVKLAHYEKEISERDKEICFLKGEIEFAYRGI